MNKRVKSINSIFIKWICLFLGIMILTVIVQTEVFAADTMQEYSEQRNNIVRVESICWDGEDSVYKTRSFSGFVITTETSDNFVITIQNDLKFTAQEKEKIKEDLKTEDNTSPRIADKIEVVFQGDVRVPAEIVGESKQRNLTLLRLTKNIKFEHKLLLAEKEVSDTSKIALLYYPKTETYNAQKVECRKGTALSYYRAQKVIFMKHDLNASKLSVGGPILNQNGDVCAVLLSTGKEGGKALSLGELKDFLKTFNISYEERKTEEEEETEEKKFGVINIILAAVILLLIILIVNQLLKGKKHTVDTGKKTAASGPHLEFSKDKRTFNLPKRAIVIGRSNEADLVLGAESGASRKHARMEYEAGQYYLSDLNSTNHTYLNGKKLNPGEKKVLKDKDTIQFADEKLVFRK